MSLENDIFKRYSPIADRLLAYGFSFDGVAYKYSQLILDGEFRAEIEIKNGEVHGRVIELAFGEEYTTFRIDGAFGAFVGRVRAEYENMLFDIRDKCFERLDFISDQANRVSREIKRIYNDRPEFLWDKHIGYGVFREPETKKWYAVIMNIPKDRIADGEGEVEIINVKTDSRSISERLTEYGVYPAYHMNKKHWVSVLLDGSVSDETVIGYIKESHSFSGKKR